MPAEPLLSLSCRLEAVQRQVGSGPLSTEEATAMAMFPCDATNHRYRDAQQTIYPAVVNHARSYRRKLRLCPQHFDGYFQKLEYGAQSQQLDLDGDGHSRCLICRQDVAASTFQFFATVYARGAERADYWAPLHDACAPAALEDWGMESEMPF